MRGERKEERGRRREGGGKGLLFVKRFFSSYFFMYKNLEESYLKLAVDNLNLTELGGT